MSTIRIQVPPMSHSQLVALSHMVAAVAIVRGDGTAEAVGYLLDAGYARRLAQNLGVAESRVADQLEAWRDEYAAGEA